jgi:valyl-tRNA synthetase
MLKPQWYVKCDDMAAQAKFVVDNGQLKIIPDIHVKTWHAWMDGSRFVVVLFIY